MTRPFSVGLLTLGVILMGTAFSGCGSQSTCAGCGGPEIPHWYLETPSDPDYVYGIHSNTSSNLREAVDSTLADARRDLANRLEKTLKRETEDVREAFEKDQSRVFSSLTKEAADSVARGATAKDKKVEKQDNGTYRAFALFEVPLHEAAQTLLQLTGEHERLRNRFQASEEYQNLSTKPDAEEAKQ